MRQKVRYAIVGLGHISQAAVLPAFKHAENSELVAFVSNDPAKMQKLGKEYGVKHFFSYDRYQDCLKSGLIDAVYIALPNHLHAEYTEMAAHEGIHVLCEKPMALNEEECFRMIDATDSSQVKLMIAYRLHFEEANLKAIEYAHSGKLGNLRFFNSSFSFQVKDEENIRLRNETGGGTLFDIGIYCINAARYLFRSEPIEVMAMTARNNEMRFSEVEEMTGAILRFPDDQLAVFTCSFGAADTGYYEIVGSEGSLCLDSAYEYTESMVMDVTGSDGKTKTQTFSKRDQFAPELLYFSDCILKNLEPEPSGREGLIDVKIIQALYESAQTGKVVQVELSSEVEDDQRPDLAQEIRRPAILKQPKMVKTNGPRDKSHQVR